MTGIFLVYLSTNAKDLLVNEIGQCVAHLLACDSLFQVRFHGKQVAQLVQRLESPDGAHLHPLYKKRYG